MTNMYTHDTAKIMYILRTLRLLSMLFFIEVFITKKTGILIHINKAH